MLYMPAVIAGIQPGNYIELCLGEITDIIRAYNERRRQRAMDMQSESLLSFVGKKHMEFYEAYEYLFTPEEIREIKTAIHAEEMKKHEKSMDLWMDRLNKQLGGDENG